MKTSESKTHVILLSGTAVAGILVSLYSLSFTQIIYQQQQTAHGAEATTKVANNMSNTTKSNVIVQQGTVSSGPPMGPTDTLRIAPILNPRHDGSIYTGTFTYTASKKVEILIGHSFGINSSSSMINSTYLEPENFELAPGLQVAASVIAPNYGSPSIPSASIPFSGNSLGVMTFNSEPFIVTYSLKAEIDKPTVINNFTNALVKTQAAAPGSKVSILPNAAAISNKTFSPNPINVKVGSTVTWTNNDTETHTVTSGLGLKDPNQGKRFDSGLIGPRQTFTQTFKTTGDFNYFCQIHPAMVGKVSVK